MRGSILVVLLALSLVLAGCNGPVLGGEETPARTLTPAPVPTDRPTPTPVPQLAPGFTGGGVTDPFALADAHAAVFENTSFTMQGEFSVAYPNGTDYRRTETDARFAANQSRYYIVINRSGATFNGSTIVDSRWSNGTRVLRARTIDGNTSYSVRRDSTGEQVQPQDFSSLWDSNERIAALFSSVETRVVGSTTRNGTTLYRVVTTDVTYRGAFERGWQNPRNVTLVAFVDSRGLVREYRLNYTATLDNSTVRVHRRVRYTDLGNTTVERPPWYEAAIENATTTG